MSAIKDGSEVLVGSTEALSTVDVVAKSVFLSNGRMAMMWRTVDGGVVNIQILEADGTKVGNQIDYNPQYLVTPEIAALSGGGFAIVGKYNDSAGDPAILMQLFRNNGQTNGSAKTVDDADGRYYQNSSVTELASGDILVTWESYIGRAYTTVARMFSPSGTPRGDEVVLFDGTDLGQRDSTITALKNGGFVVTWEGNSDIADGRIDVFVQRFDEDGQRKGPTRTVNTYTRDDQIEPVVTALEDGGYMVVWHGSPDLDGFSWGTFGRVFNKFGKPKGDEFQVNTFATSDQWSPDVKGMPDGGFVVTWSSAGQGPSNASIVGQRYDAKGATIGDEFIVTTIASGQQWHSSIDVEDDGSFVVSWQSWAGINNWKVYLQKYEAQTFGTSKRDTLKDGAGADWIDGLAGADSLFGQQGSDEIYGSAGDDYLNGARGSDQLYGGIGEDELHGGQGTDTLYGGGDNDLLYGDGLKDEIYGGAGRDLLVGGRGNDDLYGGSGADVFRFKAGNDGIDKVMGFEAGRDMIEVQNASAVTVTDNGTNTRIEFDGASGAIRLMDVVLTESDITFQFI